MQSSLWTLELLSGSRTCLEEADRWARPFIHLSFIHLSIHSLLTPVLELHHYICNIGASLVAQLVKNLSAVQETWVRSLGWGDPLEKEMATHSRILAWKISWTEEPGRPQSMGSQRVGHDWVTSLSLYISWSCTAHGLTYTHHEMITIILVKSHHLIQIQN